MRRKIQPDGAEPPRRDHEGDRAAPEATSQPGLNRRPLELPDGRYLIAYERAKKPADA
ncbi:MAG TPA: hypothetical protein VKT20_12005 [Candidatus Dormibacteraeota bacterium]|nr:hypothetical protein [Candidatus Dormibacteraeota bacterium]